MSTEATLQDREHEQAESTEQTRYAAALGKVYVVDDDAEVLAVIAMQLQSVGYDVSTFNHPVEFLRAADQLAPGVVVTDQRMPEVQGLDLQKKLLSRSHRFQVIILSGYPETAVAVEATKLGAVTVLDKPFEKNKLVDSIEKGFELLEAAAAEETRLPTPLPDGQKYIDRLSRREREVVDCVYDGATNKSIGIQLGISIKTVEKHRGKAMKKMEVNSLPELVRLMVRESHS